MTKVDELKKLFASIIKTEEKPLPPVIEFQESDKLLLQARAYGMSQIGGVTFDC